MAFKRKEHSAPVSQDDDVPAVRLAKSRRQQVQEPSVQSAENGLFISMSGDIVVRNDDGKLEFAGKPGMAVTGWMQPLHQGERIIRSFLHLNNGVIENMDGPAAVSYTGDTVICGTYRKGKIESVNDEPAVTEYDLKGNEIRRAWFKNGTLHRTGKPALEMVIGGFDIEGWYLDGQMHRKGGPASIRKKGDVLITEAWYNLGIISRTDGPALIEHDTKIQKWIVDGELHRLDGAALKGPGYELYYIAGKEVTRQEASKAFLENRGAAVGRVASTAKDLSTESDDDRAARLKSNISNWSKSNGRKL